MTNDQILSMPCSFQLWRSRKHPTRVVRIKLTAKRGSKVMVVHTLEKGIESFFADELNYFLERFERIK